MTPEAPVTVALPWVLWVTRDSTCPYLEYQLHFVHAHSHELGTDFKHTWIFCSRNFKQNVLEPESTWNRYINSSKLTKFIFVPCAQQGRLQTTGGISHFIVEPLRKNQPHKWLLLFITAPLGYKCYSLNSQVSNSHINHHPSFDSIFWWYSETPL